MMKEKKYYIDKKNNVKEMVFTSYDTNYLYLLSPKRQKKDEVKVNNILITDSKMIEKIVKKKIEMKLDKYVKVINILNQDDDTDWGTISQVLMDAEKFRMKLINEYLRFLGKQYRLLSVQKIDLIIEELRKMRYRTYNNYLNVGEKSRKGR